MALTLQEIQAKCTPEEIAARNDEALAAKINVGRKKLGSRMVSARAILGEINNGAAILDKLELAAASVSAVKWALFFLKSDGGLDVGHPSTQAQLTALAAGGVLTEEEATALKNLALLPDLVTAHEVTVILNEVQ